MSVAAAKSFKMLWIWIGHFEIDSIAAKQHRHRHLKTWLAVRLFLGRGNWSAQMQPTSALEMHCCSFDFLTWNGQMIFCPRRCIMVRCLFFSIQLISKSLCTKRPLWKHIQVNLMQSHFCWSNEVRECQGWGPCHQNKTRNSPSTWEKSV